MAIELPLKAFRRRRSSTQENECGQGSRYEEDGSAEGPNHASGSGAPTSAIHLTTSRTPSTRSLPMGRSATDGARPSSPSLAEQVGVGRSHRPLSVDTSNQSVMALFREDYVSARMYMKELDYRQALRKALRRHMYKWYAILVIAIVLTALITVKHETVVEFCAPVTRTIRAWPGGWMIPIAILIVVSFPPLVGHEIIGILCGLVWGLWVGFAILAAGTFLGEIATWIAFKWCCQGRAAKFEKKNKLYAALTQLIREKSFTFTLVLRFSAVPGHIVTAVSASAGANFWQYLAAAFLTLPKQWTIVYLGKAFGTQSRKNTIISICTTVATLIGTVVAAIYVYYQMRIVMRRNALTLPMVVESTSAATMAEITDEKRDLGGVGNGLHARRPWLYTQNSTYSSANGSGFRTPTRSWSMPGHMNEEELREWVEEIQYEQAANAELNTEGDSKRPAIRIDGDGAISGVFDDLPPVFSPMLEMPPARRSMPSASGTSTPYFVETDLLVPSRSQTLTANPSEADLPAYTYPPTPPKRGESSTSRSPAPVDQQNVTRQSGRDLADEADAYAYSRGARRPDYSRMRGDSRAALLGRPMDDATLEMGGASWRREYTRTRGDSGAALMGRPASTSDDLDANAGLGKAIESWKRDYGRSRGDSGAALLGRPASSVSGSERGADLV
ncbi:hypothetical protein IAU60_002993 [Kwoniella sp. DSM 27419]